MGNGCCEKTRIGDSTFIFSHIDSNASSFYCASQCVYEKEGEPGSQYCLRYGNDKAPICESQECPDGWKEFKGKCYKYMDIAKTWADAEAVCNNQTLDGVQGHLASVHSEEENVFVASLANEESWIGGHDIYKDGHWAWSDGSPFDYQNWNVGEPNNYENDEDCLEIHHSSTYGKDWNDEWCSDKLNFVCKMNIGNLCEDNHKDCQYWSNAGECNKNPSYMLTVCRKSCNVCSYSTSSTTPSTTTPYGGIWKGGYCADPSTGKQQRGFSHGHYPVREDCLNACKKIEGVTGCEYYYTGTCQVKTREVIYAPKNYYGWSCYVFVK